MLALEFGMGKTGASYRVMIISLERELKENESCPDPQLKKMHEDIIKKLIQRAKQEIANLNY